MWKTLVFLFCAIVSSLSRRLPEERVIGGENYNINQVPFQISMQTSDGFHFCGGSMVDSKTVLTAAHCCAGLRASDVRVRAKSSNRKIGGELVGVTQVISHPNFSSRTINFDFCVLKLSKPIQTTFAKLPTPNVDIAAGTSVTLSGWGRISNNSPYSPDVLQGATITVLDKNQCNRNYGYSLTENMFCAGTTQGGKNSCQGDSGGPLSSNGVLYGVVSFGGEYCADKFHPSVYANVPRVVSWVKQFMN